MIVLAIIWLGMVEGEQGALVGLPPVKRALYEASHPLTHQCCELVQKGDNLDRYLMGRQFVVCFIVFVTNLSCAPLADAQVLGLPDFVISTFLGTGVAMILVTAMVGQLANQVNASQCMLDFINNYFAVFTLYVAMIIEMSGLLHSCYLVQMFFVRISGNEKDSKEDPRTAGQNVCFWARVLMSCAILGFCFAVTLSALFNGQTTMWEGVPPAVAVIIFFVLMSVIGVLEGMQIAFFAVAKLPRDEQANHPIAMKTCDLLFRGDDRCNWPSFMIGRQVCVTLCFFVIARVTTVDIDVDAGDETIFGVPNGLQAFFNTGILGAIITTICGSITWQLVASSFPVAFLSNPMVYIFLRWCLFLECTGICSGAWVVAGLRKKIAGFQYDEVYIGTPEERATLETTKDDVETLEVRPGHMYPGTNGVHQPGDVHSFDVYTVNAQEYRAFLTWKKMHPSYGSTRSRRPSY